MNSHCLVDLTRIVLSRSAPISRVVHRMYVGHRSSLVRDPIHRNKQTGHATVCIVSGGLDLAMASGLDGVALRVNKLRLFNKVFIFMLLIYNHAGRGDSGNVGEFDLLGRS